MDVSILLVEDSPTDAAILSAALDDVGCQWPIHVAQTADEALNFLEQTDNGIQTHPQLILLDLNLPGKTGHEILREIKCNDVWCAIPVIVLSSSATPHDIHKSYQLHANAYITKPTDFSEYQLIAQKICDFWLEAVKLPGKG